MFNTSYTKCPVCKTRLVRIQKTSDGLNIFDCEECKSYVKVDAEGNITMTLKKTLRPKVCGCGYCNL